MPTIRILCLATLIPALAIAADPTDTANSGSTSGELSEIVVSASKLRSTYVLDTPNAVQAISGDLLAKENASGFLDIATTIPGLAVDDQGPGDRKYVIRGINSTGEATTGVYYDEAIISGSNANDGGGLQADIRLYDLDHVEVLRGPQGTLYGAGSMSGTIRFITKKPDLTNFGGYLTAEVSETQHGGENHNLNGELNLPVVDGQLALRVVGWAVNDSGYIDQLHVGTVGLEKGTNTDEVRGGRISLRYQPFENLTLDFSYTGQSENTGGPPDYTPAAGVTSVPKPSIIGCDLCNLDVNLSMSHDELQVYSFTGTYNFKYGTITATTNQFNRHYELEFDTSAGLEALGVGINFPTEELEPQKRDLNSSELRYASNFDFPVNFVAGVFRQHETNDLMADSVKSNDLGLPNGPFSSCNCDDALSHPDGNSVFGRDDNRTTTEYAGFGQATWQVNPELALVGGIRYFTETLEGVQEQTHPFGGFPPGPTLVPVLDTTSTFSKTTFLFNASYKFNRGLLLYATASEGFRGGGLNPLSEPFDPIPAAFGPDTLWNYEVGAKGALLNGRFTYQVDQYQIRWSNIQVRETTADGAFNYIGNAGDARVNGTELELNARIIDNLTASLAGSYQDAYLTRGATPAQYALNPTLGLTGESIPEVPRFNFSFGLDYTQKLNDNWTGVMAATVSHRGGVNSYFASNSNNIPLDGYTLLYLRAGLMTGPWRVDVFARNATNERAQVSASSVAGQPIALITVRPRTIGVTLTRTF